MKILYYEPYVLFKNNSKNISFLNLANGLKLEYNNKSSFNKILKRKKNNCFIVEHSDVSGNYKCEISVNRNASVSASLITDFQRKKLKNVIFKDSFSIFQPV